MNNIVVYTQGTWDLFHTGHLNIIKKSQQVGTRLIVGVSTDRLVKSYKGIYPIVPCNQRIEIIRSCRYVDDVVVQDNLIPVQFLYKKNIDIVTIGDDWKNKYLEGIDWMKKNKRTVIYIPYTKEVSSSSIKQRIKHEL